MFCNQSSSNDTDLILPFILRIQSSVTPELDDWGVVLSSSDGDIDFWTPSSSCASLFEASMIIYRSSSIASLTALLGAGVLVSIFSLFGFHSALLYFSDSESLSQCSNAVARQLFASNSGEKSSVFLAHSSPE